MRVLWLAHDSECMCASRSKLDKVKKHNRDLYVLIEKLKGKLDAGREQHRTSQTKMSEMKTSMDEQVCVCVVCWWMELAWGH